MAMTPPGVTPGEPTLPRTPEAAPPGSPTPPTTPPTSLPPKAGRASAPPASASAPVPSPPSTPPPMPPTASGAIPPAPDTPPDGVPPAAPGPPTFPDPEASGAAPRPGYPADDKDNGDLWPGSLQSTARLRKATITLFWIAVALSAATTLAYYSRISVWDDFIVGEASLDKLDEADVLVSVIVVVKALVMLAAAIVLSIWSLRTVRNVERFVGPGLKPGLACGGWYVPIGNLWVPFARLREASDSVSNNSIDVSRWQAGWIAMVICAGFNWSAFDLDSFTRTDIRNTLSNEATFSIVILVVTALTALVAMGAMNHLDKGIARRAAATVPDSSDGAG